MQAIAGNVWFGGSPPIGVVLYIEGGENGDVQRGRIEGLSADQLNQFEQSAEQRLEVEGRKYDVRVKPDGTFAVARRIE